MEAAILEQQEQQEKVDYKESFPTTNNKQTTKNDIQSDLMILSNGVK